MRITESRLRHIIRQEVRRSRLTEMAAPGAGKLAVFEFSFPDLVLPSGMTVLDALKGEAAVAGMPAPIQASSSLGGYAVMVGPLKALESVRRTIERDVGDVVVEFKTGNIQKYLEGTEDATVARGLKGALTELGWSPAAPGAKMAMLPVSLAEAEENGFSVEDLQGLAAGMGLQGKVGRGAFTVTGPRPAVEKFALELESSVMGGAQSISGDEGLFAKIRNV